jgi:hypothetical protein
MKPYLHHDTVEASAAASGSVDFRVDAWVPASQGFSS